MSEENVVDPTEVIVPINDTAALKRRIDQLEDRFGELTKATSDITNIMLEFDRFKNEVNAWRQHIVMGINNNAQEYGIRLLVIEQMMVGDDPLSKEIRTHLSQGENIPMEKLSKLVETIIIPQLQEQFQQTAEKSQETPDNVIQLTDFQK